MAKKTTQSATKKKPSSRATEEAAVAKASAAPREPRRLRPPTYKSFRLRRRIKYKGPRLSSSWGLFVTTMRTIASNWKLFGGILLIYGLLNIVLAQGLLGGLDVTGTKQAVQSTPGGLGRIAAGALLLSSLADSGGAATQATNAYQAVIMVLTSLAFIAAFRHVRSDEADMRLTPKEAFYSSTHALIQFVLVIVVISLQMIPVAVAAAVYSVVVDTGLAVGPVEQIIWLLLFLAMATVSFYMITSSVFGLYIVTLPSMTPLRALRSARELVRNRRWMVLRKILALPIIIMVLMLIIMTPLILFATQISAVVFFVLSLALLPVIHGYMYSLYRELLV